MQQFLKRFFRAERGLAFIEFAMVAPFIMLILFGAIELTRLMLIVQKVDKSAYAMADLVAQQMPATAQRRTGEINIDEMNNVVFRQFEALMSPYDAQVNGSVIVSSIRSERGNVRIKWQVASPGGYSDADTISIVSGLSPAGVNGAAGSLRDRVASFTGDAANEINGMLGYENMIVSEVFFRYRPILANVLSGLPSLLGGQENRFVVGETTLVRRVYSRPRNGNMICLPPTFTYDECIDRTPASVGLPPLAVVRTCTPITGSGSCFDECNKCRANAREWCTASGTVRNLVRCNNGTYANQNVAGGCAGVGTISCE